MTKRPQTSTEFTILSIDAERGILYSSFDDFWERRMEPLQFIAPNAKGVLARVRDRIMDHAREQWILWITADGNRSASRSTSTPQAGELADGSQ